ncbi:MAG: GNAT family N-acetyltransferase [Chelatococcus sp.]|uniref:GNAT family N-acetyltransferase n=1 Tax=Chelatococcus sp. TaxID=1953771 RepID=UPI0025BCC374|nr:GNAT family N-acetyltransferase [Chelatococcus sp.]MBX3536316.1 GNAT family N-acetyltransferase [Chelatococcus sp.]
MNGLAVRLAAATDHTAVLALQHAAFARNRERLGVEPLPLLADYGEIFAGGGTWEIWLAVAAEGIAGVLILMPRQDDLYIWSIATDPAFQGRGVGRALLAHALARAQALELSSLRLCTRRALSENIAWYARAGFVIEREELMPDRVLVHMAKALTAS